MTALGLKKGSQAGLASMFTEFHWLSSTVWASLWLLGRVFLQLRPPLWTGGAGRILFLSDSFCCINLGARNLEHLSLKCNSNKHSLEQHSRARVTLMPCRGTRGPKMMSPSSLLPLCHCAPWELQQEVWVGRVRPWSVGGGQGYTATRR